MSHLSTPLVFPLGGDTVQGKNVNDLINSQFFGIDLLFTNDLHLTPKADWQVIAGLQNLRQAIYRRLQVKPGEFKLRPEYGVGVASYVKKAMPRSRIDELKQRIVSQLSQERRIDQVVDVQVTPTTFGEDTGVRIRITVKVLGQTVRFKPFNFAQEK